MSANTITNLLAELHHADHIIKVMLNALTAQQKAEVGAQLDAAGVAGEGMTRHHERLAAIKATNIEAAADAPTTSAQARTVNIGITRQQLGDIEAQALSAQTLCEVSFEELDRITTTAPDVVHAVLRLDALIKSTCRNAVLIQETAEAAGAVLLGQGGVA